jgi:hypothetical protein
LQDPISKKPITKKRAGGVAQGVDPEFKLQYCKKKKRNGPQSELFSLFANLPQDDRCTQSLVEMAVSRIFF